MSEQDDIEWLQAALKVRGAELELRTLERNQARREHDELRVEKGSAKEPSEQPTEYAGELAQVADEGLGDGLLAVRRFSDGHATRVYERNTRDGTRYAFYVYNEAGKRIGHGIRQTLAMAQAEADSLLRISGLLPPLAPVAKPSEPSTVYAGQWWETAGGIMVRSYRTERYSCDVARVFILDKTAPARGYVFEVFYRDGTLAHRDTRLTRQEAMDTADELLRERGMLSPLLRSTDPAKPVTADGELRARLEELTHYLEERIRERSGPNATPTCKDERRTYEDVATRLRETLALAAPSSEGAKEGGAQ